MQELIVSFLEKVEKNKSRFLTPRLEAAVMTIYEFKDEEQSIRFQLSPARIVEFLDIPAHCSIYLPSAEWSSIFSGTSSIMSKVMAGKTNFLKHNRRQMMHLSMLMHAVTLGAKND